MTAQLADQFFIAGRPGVSCLSDQAIHAIQLLSRMFFHTSMEPSLLRAVLNRKSL